MAVAFSYLMDGIQGITDIPDLVLDTGDIEDAGPAGDEDIVDYYRRETFRLYRDYFALRAIDISGLAFAKVPNSVYQAAFRFVYNDLFRLPAKITRQYRIKSKLDYSDALLMSSLIDIYTDILDSYSIVGHVGMFTAYTGMEYVTLDRWISGDIRSYIYRRPDGSVIKDVWGYVVQHGRDYVREESTIHSDIVAKLKRANNISLHNRLPDSSLGVLALANNDREYDKLYTSRGYAERRLLDTAITAAQLPTFGGPALPDTVQVDAAGDTDT